MENKYGVESHEYEITLSNGDVFVFDVADEESWGDVQQMTPFDFGDVRNAPPDWSVRVGWGNDSDGHVEIVEVVDCETNDRLDPWAWANERVWCYTENYSC